MAAGPVNPESPANLAGWGVAEVPRGTVTSLALGVVGLSHYEALLLHRNPPRGAEPRSNGWFLGAVPNKEGL
jgi:hypothetical protein